MTQLGIKLYQPHALGSVESAAILSVRLLADSSGKVTKLSWSQEKPASVVGEEILEGFTVFDLPYAGYYNVDITPPRGPQISREYLVEDGEFLRKIVEMEVSPHEYLGWQQYAGILRNNPYTEETESHSAPGDLPFGVEKRGIRIGDVDQPTRAPKEPDAVPIVWAMASDPPELMWPWAKGWISRFDPFPFGPSQVLNWQFRADQEFVTWFPPMPSPDDGLHLVDSLRHRYPPPYAAMFQFPRWICFQAGRQIDLASVPWSWFGGDYQRGPADEIRFLYDRVRTSSVDRKSAGYLNLSVQDQRWFGLLQFLSSDRMNRAGDLVDELFRNQTAEAAMDGKVKGPLAAVAGAIVLVTQAKTTEDQTWDSWLYNLSNWFPAIPDGPILLGSRLLQKAQTFEELLEAYRNLYQGFSRGIPYFSATLRMLDMALAQIGDAIPEAEILRRDIAFVSSRVDPAQPFTILRIRLNE